MAKRNLKQDINEINKMSKKIPTLMETINFSPEREMEMCEEDGVYPEEELPMEQPMGKPMEKTMAMPGKDIVDQIRKMALKAMAELADNTEDSYYLVLKKIWQMADKNPEEGKMNKE